MPNTHYIHIVGDAHLRGARLGFLDRLRGRMVSLVAPPSPPAAENDIVRGSLSGTVARVVHVISPTELVLEAMVNTTPIYTAFGFSATAFGQNHNMAGFPLTGETLNFDSGGTAQIGAAANQSVMPLGAQLPEQMQDSDLRAVPADLASDTVWWDRGAQLSRLFRMTNASLTGPAPQFKAGDRCTVPGGGAFTVQLASTIGSDLILRVFKVTGTVNAGQIVTNATTGANQGTLSLVSAANPVSIWVPYHPMPNLDSQGTYYERNPLGNATDRGFAGLGPDARLVPAMADYYAQQVDTADRGIRVVAHSSNDDLGTDGILGGVSVQVVKCSGTFSVTWQAGEVVNGPGGWSATVHGFNSGLKYLFVRKTNGVTLSAGSITGVTSGAVGTADGAAFGWQKGSRHWNNWLANTTAATNAPAGDSTFGGVVGVAAPKAEGLFSMIWESELSVHARGAPFPSDAEAHEEWIRWAADTRTQLGNPNMRIVQWMHRTESQSDAVFIIPPGIFPEAPDGIPGSLRVRQWMGLLPQVIDNFMVIDSEVEGYKMARQRSAPVLPGFETPEFDSKIWLRPLDYYQLGADFFRYWTGGQVEVLPGEGYTPLPVGILIGQSNATGFINAGTAIAFDGDPELYPHNNFAPGLSTIDSNGLAWNFRTHSIQPYDISVTGNGSFGTQSGTCGSDPPLVQRQKMRFSSDPDNSFPFLLFKCTVPGSSANRDVIDATACWDPELATRTALTATCTVTSIPATSSTPSRGRFTAAVAGVFDPNAWPVNLSVTIIGSALGNVSTGGNNTAPYNVVRVRAVAPDGSWIEFANGVFATEATRNFTFTAGPPPIWPYFRQEWRRMVSACRDLGYVPHPVWAINIQGEGDLNLVEGYQAALQRVWSAVIAECDIGAKLPGRTQMAKIQVLTHARTGWPVDSETIAQQRQVQSTVMASLQNAKTLDISDLALELRGGIFPRTQREDNGLHLTGRGFITQGFRLDALLGTMTGIPAHPNGELALDFGAVQGGVALPAPALGDIELRSGLLNEPDAGSTLVVEDGSGLSNADSYQSLGDIETRIALRGNVPAAWTSATLEQKNDWARDAAKMGVDLMFGMSWSGYRTDETQSLDWPRIGAGDNRTGRAIPENVVPDNVKWMQVEWIRSLASGVDPLRSFNPENDSAAFATSTSDSLPGGFNESRSYDTSNGAGRPVLPVLTRLWMLARPFLMDTDSVGLA